MNLIQLRKIWKSLSVAKFLNLNPQLKANWTIEFKPSVCMFNYGQKQQNERTS